MKYISHYKDKILYDLEKINNLRNDVSLKDFCEYLKELLSKYSNGLEIEIRDSTVESTFWLIQSSHYYQHLCAVQKIDHYYDDPYWFFGFKMDTNLKDKKISEDLLELIKIINDEIAKYSYAKQNIIRTTDIPNIISDINNNLYRVDAKKYNL